MTITAIETRYAGCRFRSRLEARWAVFFDHLGIRWEYEPQGYFVGPDQRPYLPDFRWPDLHTLVEVKGDADRLDLGTLIQAARDCDVYQLLILGEIPRCEALKMPLHSSITMAVDADPQQGHFALLQHIAFMKGKGPTTVPFGTWFIPGMQGVAESPAQILNPDPTPWILPQRVVQEAYEAARSARFEHGECG